MIANQVVVDQNLLELVPYKNPDFPLARFIDQFDLFADGAFLCHWHPEFEMAIVLQGCVEYHLDQQSFVLHPGEGLLIGAKTLHHARQLVPNTEVFNIVYSPMLIHAAYASPIYQTFVEPVVRGKHIGYRITDNTSHGHQILQGLMRIYQADENAFGYELFCMEVLLSIWRNNLLLIEAERPNTSNSDDFIREHRMRKMLAYIQVHFQEAITVEEIATAASISRSECFRCFSLFCNTAPMEHVNRTRLEHAAQRLIDSHESITDICFSSGFSSISYFGKAFRKAYGYAPSDYRKRSKEQGL